MRSFTLILFFLLLKLSCFAQNNSNQLLDSAKANYASYQYDRAILFLKKAEKTEQNKALFESVLGDIYYELNILFLTVGDYEYALKYSKKALSFYQNQKKRNNNKIAKSHQAIGINYFYKNEYSLAKQYFEIALKSETSNNNEELAITYNYLGNIYGNLNNPELAIQYKFKSAEIYTQIYGKEHIIPSKVNLSTLFLYDARLDKSLKNLSGNVYEAINELSFTSLNKKFTIEDYRKPLFLVYGYTNTAYGFSRMKKYKDAIVYFKKALKEQLKIYSKNHSKLISFYEAIANTYLLNNNYDSALVYCNKAITLNTKNLSDSLNIHFLPKIDFCLDEYKLLNCVFLKGNLYLQKQKTFENLKYAYNCYNICDSLIGKIRRKFNANEDKLLFAKDAESIYNAAITNCFQISSLSKLKQTDNKYLRKAFYFSQKSKSKVLEELTNKISKKNNLPQYLKIEEKEIQDKINFFEQRRSENIILQSKNRDTLFRYYRKLLDSDTIIRNSYEDSLLKYNQKFKTFQNNLKRTYPKYYNLKYEKEAISIEEIQKLLLPNNAMIDYHLNKKTIEIFLITKSNFIAKQVPLYENIDSLIQIYRGSISKFYKKLDFINKSKNIFLENGRKLYDFLIKPIEKEIKNKKKLLIIVSGSFSRLPFETLVPYQNKESENDLSKLNYLIKKHEIVYNYSEKLWKNSVIKTQKYTNLKNSLLAIAPVFSFENNVASLSEEETETNMNARDIDNLGELPATKNAIEKVYNLTKEKGFLSEKYLFAKANEKTFKIKSTQKKYILLATHGKTDNENPKLSGLYFSASRNNEKELNDGFLYANEIYNLDLKADLIVLYACETGVGKIKKGEGTMALSRGFVASGAANIIQTLWKIQDVSTKDLVIDLFKNILEKKSYSASLREAKLKMINYGISPFHWSGLVLIGN